MAKENCDLCKKYIGNKKISWIVGINGFCIMNVCEECDLDVENQIDTLIEGMKNGKHIKIDKQ